ncbi:hypothetical protein J3F84DRAFT_368946 [Trichoderma pleuroticola]
MGMASLIQPVGNRCQRPGPRKLPNWALILSGQFLESPSPRLRTADNPSFPASPIPVPEGSCPKKGNKAHVKPGWQLRHRC